MVTIPTVQAVKEALNAFSAEYEVDERALSELVRLFPRHDDAACVLLKVMAVNALYSTTVYAFKSLAKVMHENKELLDQWIDAGDLRAFDVIEFLDIPGQKVRSRFSFASKYLAWHKPDVYPIYDSRVDRYITALTKDMNLPFPSSARWKYPDFVKIVNDIRTLYGLNQFTYKQLDAFFFLEGEKLSQK